MSTKSKRIILFVALVQLLVAVLFLALPPVVRALPGAYYIRLQHHPLTAGVMELLTTPIPTALPAPLAFVPEEDREESLAIPGLEGVNAPLPTATATATTEP